MDARVEPIDSMGATLGLAARLNGLLAWCAREALALAIGTLYAIVLMLAMPAELVQDSWSTLVGGREIAQHGLPRHETLTVMAHGVRWVDQQWLAQVTFYELFRAGGYRLILLVHVSLIVSAFVLALIAARRRGGSPLAVFLVAGICAFVAPWGWQLRAQSFAPLLFVAVLALLVSDARRRSPRVFVVLPLLALWANLHGSVLLGAALVALYGVTLLLARQLVAGGTLLVTAPVAVLASPYGLALVGYYRHLLISPPFGRLVNEWMAPTPGAVTALFYVLALLTVWAVGRHSPAVTPFEGLALLLTLGAALHATRNIVWFGLTALVLVPALIDSAPPERATSETSRARPTIALGLVAVLVAVATVTATKPANWYPHFWPSNHALAVLSTATRAPETRVFAADQDADWLLWRLPHLRGRVAFDIRFELNTEGQVRRLHNFFGRVGPGWQVAARGYDVIVLNRKHDSVRRSLLGSQRFRQAYLDDDLAVLVRMPQGRR